MLLLLLFRFLRWSGCSLRLLAVKFVITIAAQKNWLLPRGVQDQATKFIKTSFIGVKCHYSACCLFGTKMLKTVLFIICKSLLCLSVICYFGFAFWSLFLNEVSVGCPFNTNFFLSKFHFKKPTLGPFVGLNRKVINNLEFA